MQMRIVRCFNLWPLCTVALTLSDTATCNAELDESLDRVCTGKLPGDGHACLNQVVSEEGLHNDEVRGGGDWDECPKFNVKYESIMNYLNPKLFENPETLEDIGQSLRDGELIVIRNAFNPIYAEAMHCDLDRIDNWELHEEALDDGFHYSHHNIYNPEDFTEMMNATLAMFEHPDSKRWMSELSGRNCYGDTFGSEGSASFYMPGDHSLPHTDQLRQRSVAYVWHLSKNWQPEWGGALYWCPENLHNSFLHASFNTLSLFSVSSRTAHFVTAVNHLAEEKRLSFNGWYQSSWLPTLDDNLEELLDTPEKRRDITNDQFDELGALVWNENTDLDPERRERLQILWYTVQDEVWPEEQTSYVVEL